MKFVIEQIALAPPDPEKALELLRAMGAEQWVKDIVVARGKVEPDMYGIQASSPIVENVAHLAFNYSALEKARELEVLHYSAGKNWLDGEPPRVGHFGMHVTVAELREWRIFFERRKICVVQEVNTISHSNPEIAGKRFYHYVIFDTHKILGVDLKFIVRHDVKQDAVLTEGNP